MKRAIPPQAGFSLMEMLVVVALIGILSGIALTSFLANWEDERLNAASKTTLAWLDDLRRQAIQHSSPCRATWDLEAVSLSASCDHDPGTIRRLNLRAEIRNSDALTVALVNDDAPTTWVFTPRGTSNTSAQALFTLEGSSSDPGRCLRLIAPLGLLKTARRNAAGQCDYTTAY